MAHRSAPPEAGSEHRMVWDEEIAREAFAGFDIPRRRITGGRPRPADVAQRNGRSNGATNGYSRPNGANGRTPQFFDVEAHSGGDPAAAPVNGHAAAPADGRAAGTAIPGRRTVTIRGHGAERNLPRSSASRRRNEPPHRRSGFQADRMAMWAVLLGIMLVVVAAASAKGAVLGHGARLTTSHRAARPAAVVRSAHRQR